MPSPPVAVVTIVLVGAVYTLVVAGAPRRRAKVVLVVLVAVYSFARLYLAVDHPFDVIVAIALGRGHPGQRVPLLHAQRGLPGHVPQGQDGPPRRHRRGGARPSVKPSATSSA